MTTDPAPAAAPEETLAEGLAGHRYHIVDGRGGQWLCETSDKHPEPSPIARVDDLLNESADLSTQLAQGARDALLAAAADLDNSDGRFIDWLRDRADQIEARTDSGEGAS